MFLSLLSLIGMGLSVYLFGLHWTGGACLGGGSCSAVLASPYATLFGVPLGAFGVAYFLSVLGMSLLGFVDSESRARVYGWSFILSLPVLILAIGLIGVQALVIDAWCLYCLATHSVIATIVGLTGWHFIRRLRSEQGIGDLFRVHAWRFCGLILGAFVVVGILHFAMVWGVDVKVGHSNASSDNPVVSRFGRTALRLDQLDREIVLKLNDLDHKKYDARKEVLDNKLINWVAQKEGTTVSQLLDQNVRSMIQVSDIEVTQFYRENKDRLDPHSGKTEHLRQIRHYLEDQKQADAFQTYLSSLYAREDVELLLPKASRVMVRPNPYQTLIEGNSSAPNHIVVFSDFKCGYCAQAHALFDKVLDLYPGKFRVEYRQYPLGQNPISFKAAEAVACMTPEKGLELTRRFFRQQAQLSQNFIMQQIKEVGGDLSQYESCVRSQKGKKSVFFDQEEGSRLGVSRTPTVIVNGRYFEGIPPMSVFQKLGED